MKKLLSLFLSICLLVQLTAPAFAAETASVQPAQAAEQADETTLSDVQPEASLAAEADADAPSGMERLLTDGKLEGSLKRQPLYAAKDNGYYTDVAEVVLKLRSEMVLRSKSIQLPLRVSKTEVSGEEEMEALILGIFALATAHTGVANEGDYLLWSIADLKYGGTYSETDTYYYLDVTFQMEYYSSSAIFDQLFHKDVKAIVSGFGFTEETDDYTKILSIYSFVCDTVEYDYEHLEDESYTAKFTAIAALNDGKAVCQGYALLLYAMLLTAGIDCRVIAGYDAESGIGHAWNIVQLDGVYYNLDSTWDAGYKDYAYFLKSPASFTDHTREAAFDSEDFHTLYPMAQTDYTLTLPIISSGSCGENAQYTLYATGELEITGTGAITNWNSADSTPWRAFSSYVRFVMIDEGITRVGSNSFSGIPYLLAVVLPEGMESIGRSAFSETSRLEAVLIPSTLNAIETSAFRECRKLSYVFVTDLAAWCDISFDNSEANPLYYNADFYLNEEKITDLVIPEGVTAISDYAFVCRSITSVSFPESLTSIGNYAFYQSGLEQLTIPDTVTSLGRYAFANSSLRSVTLEDGRTVLPESCFYNCVQLETVNLNSTLQTISASAFANCRKLQSIVLPASVTSVEIYAFFQCSEMQSVTFTGDAPAFGSSCFNSNPAYLYYPCDNETWTEEAMDIFNAQNYRWTKNHGEHREVGAKEPTCTEDGYTVGYQCILCDEVFSSLDVIPALGHTEVIDPGVPPTCTEGGISDGKHCSTCGEILIAQEVLPATHQYVDSVCTVCGKVEYENSGTCGDGVTWSLRADGTLTISGSGAMDDYENASYTPWVTHLQHILRVVVEPGVTRVGNYAFTKCTNLTSVSCAAPVIGKGAFSASSGSLQSLQLLEGVEEIGDSAFSAAALGHIVLPDSLKTIGTYSFSNAGVTQVTFGSGVKEFGPYAFQRNDFVEIHVPDNVTAIGQYCFAYCEKLETISIGSGVKELLRDTFDDCTSLKNVILSEGLEAIGFQVFWNCTALTTLTLPASLKSIDKPFRDCKNLTKVIFQGDRPQFIGRAQNGTLGLNGVCLYPCTNPTWHEHIHMGYGTCWIPNHVCQNGVCTLCSAPEIYKYGRTGESAMWTLDVNGTLTYYDDGVNPQVHIGSDGLPTEEYEEFVKKIVFTEGVYAIVSYAFNLYFKNVEAMFFLGDAPIMEENCFRDVTTTAYYPADNPTWTKDVMQNYGGKITWKPACVNGHTFVYVSNNDATAESDGTKTGTCSFCSKKETFPDVGSRLTGMALTTAPDKTTYIVNEPTVDMTGAVATITCADGRTFTVNVTDDMVTGFSTSAVGTKTLTVSYRGLTTTFAVTVSKATVIFQYADGTVISRAEYSYGDKVVIPPEPEKPAGTDPEYIFRGWSKKVPATCTGNATYTAVFGPKILPGDFNGDDLVTDKDAIYLLWHTLFPADYPLPSDADFNGDGLVTDKDAIYLLWHTLFPADYPLSV